MASKTANPFNPIRKGETVVVLKRKKRTKPEDDPAELVEELLGESELSDFEAAPGPDDDAPATDHTVTTYALLGIDFSGSVAHRADEVVRNLKGLVRRLNDDALTALGVRIGVVTTWEKAIAFTAAKDFEVPEFTFGSNSPLGRMTSLGCELFAAELQNAASSGRPVNKCLAAFISDGLPHGETMAETREGVRRVNAMRAGSPPLNVFSFHVGEGDPAEFLYAVSRPNPVIQAAAPEDGYRLIFEWLLGAIQSCSRSQPGQVVEMPELPRGLVCR
jgi:uncharacterized protein YegL